MSHVSDNIQPHDSVSNTGSSVSKASKASKAKITTLRIKAEFQERRARQLLEAERQQHELERLQIQEELATAVAEDNILNEPEDSAMQRPPLLHAELSSPHRAAEDLGPPVLSDPSDHTPELNPPEFSFQTDRDIVNNMPPPSNESQESQGAEGSYVTAAGSGSSYQDNLANAIVQIAEISKNSKLPAAEVQVFDGDPSAYQRFISSFKFVVESNTTDLSARLNLLIQYTSGNARKVIENCVLLPPNEGYSTAQGLLRQNFGNPSDIARKIIDSLIHGKPIPPNSSESLLEYSRQLESARISLTSLQHTADINSTTNIMLMVERLPDALQSRWAEKAFDISSTGKQIMFSDFSQFVCKRARISTSTYGKKPFNKNRAQTSSKHQDHPSRQRASFATQSSQIAKASDASVSMVTHSNSIHPENARQEFKCFVCNNSHPLYRCEAFIKMPLSER